MPAAKGNQYWKLAKGFAQGKPKKYTPKKLMEKGIAYINFCEKNPLFETKGFAYQGVVTKETFPKMRAMTIQGFCNFATMSISTWHEYSKLEAYSKVIEVLKNAFFQQKFEGAAAGLLDANIIARELGLKEHSESTQSLNITWNEEKTYEADDKTNGSS